MSVVFLRKMGRGLKSEQWQCLKFLRQTELTFAPILMAAFSLAAVDTVTSSVAVVVGCESDRPSAAAALFCCSAADVS